MPPESIGSHIDEWPSLKKSPEYLKKLDERVQKIEKDENLVEKIEGLVNRNKSGKYAMLISDAISDIGKLFSNADEKNKVVDYYDLVEEINEKIWEEYGFRVVHGELTVESLGWDLARDKPKPYYLKIKAGSIIKLKNSYDSDNICGLRVGEFKELGFGSFILI